MGSSSLGLRVARGIEYTLLAQVAVLAVNLAITPKIVHGLSVGGYALYTLMWTVLGYLLMLNAGTVVATQRFVAMWRAQGKRARLAALLRAALAFQAAMGILGGVLVWLARSWITRKFLHVDEALLPTSSHVLAWTALAAPAYFCLHFAVNVLYGLQLFSLYNLFQALMSTSVALCAAALLYFGRSLGEIAVLFAVTHALLAVAALWLARGQIMERGAEASREDLREFFGFSARSFGSQCLWMLKFQGDRIFVGGLLPLSQLGYYAICGSLAQKLNTLFGSVVTTAFPILTELHGLGERERLRKLYLKSTELTLFMVVPATILFFALVPQFMSLWLGPEFSQMTTWPVRVMLLANLAYIATNLPGAVVGGQGHPQIIGYVFAGEVALLVFLWPVLIAHWGIFGAAFGLLAAELVCVPPFVAYVHKRYLQLPWGEFFRQACYRPSLAGVGLLALTLATHQFIGSWLELIAFGSVGGSLYVGISYLLLGPEDRAFIGHWMRSRLRFLDANRQAES